MIEIEHVYVYGFDAAIRGMRNPMNSWGLSDSRRIAGNQAFFEVGEKDLELMSKLAKLGGPHAKFRRMINVTMDANAPLYWWKEFDTYKIGTVANSCSTMHKIHANEFAFKDFSTDHLFDLVSTPSTDDLISNGELTSIEFFEKIIDILNFYREKYLETKDKKYWWQLIQLLPSSYNQRRTIQLNYEVLNRIYSDRHEHKLDEWRSFCTTIERLPYSSDLITLKGGNA